MYCVFLIKIIILNNQYNTITVFINCVYFWNNWLHIVYATLFKVSSIFLNICTIFFRVFTIFFFNLIYVFYVELTCWHWDIRKTYQTFLYRFNSYHELNLFERKVNIFFKKLEYKHFLSYTNVIYYKPLKFRMTLVSNQSLNCWLFFWRCFWIVLTWRLYFNSKVRDLGPSHDIYDYNPDDNMGIYLTIGFFMLFSWFLWTWVANSVFASIMVFLLTRLFKYILSWLYWYTITIYSFI